MGRGGENQTALLSYDQVVGLHGVIVFSLSEMNNSYIQFFFGKAIIITSIQQVSFLKQNISNPGTGTGKILKLITNPDLLH